jgi:hypothetical protein
MKYMLPEAVLILIGIFFTQTYIDVCIYLFKFFYLITSLEIFDQLFLAFPFVTLLIFLSIGCLKKLPNKVIECRNKKDGITIFLKDNLFYLFVLIAFLIKVFEAVGEVGPISPYWIIQYGSFDLLMSMIGIFCISSVMLHLFFSIRNFLKN